MVHVNDDRDINLNLQKLCMCREQERKRIKLLYGISYLVLLLEVSYSLTLISAKGKRTQGNVKLNTKVPV